MTIESPTLQTNRRAFIWRPGCKRLLPETTHKTQHSFSFLPDAEIERYVSADVAQGIINRNPKKH